MRIKSFSQRLKSEKKVTELFNQCCSLSEVGDTQRSDATEYFAIDMSSQLGHSRVIDCIRRKETAVASNGIQLQLDVLKKVVFHSYSWKLMKIEGWLIETYYTYTVTKDGIYS